MDKHSGKDQESNPEEELRRLLDDHGDDDTL